MNALPVTEVSCAVPVLCLEKWRHLKVSYTLTCPTLQGVLHLNVSYTSRCPTPSARLASEAVAWP
jgi:hypothetical protein